MHRGKRHFLDYWLIVPYIILCTIGMVMVYSASSDISSQNGGTPLGYLIKQGIYLILGIALMAFMTMSNLSKWRNAWLLKIIIGLLFVSLIIVLFGPAVNGAKGWINIGSFSLQPAEFVKLGLILYLANTFDHYKQSIMREGMFRTTLNQRDLWVMWGVVLIFLLLILKQPDTGGFAIVGSIVLVMLFGSGINWKYGVSLVGVALVGLGVLLGPVANYLASSGASGYRYARFIAFANPFGTASGAGSQLVNSYYAIARGGLFGVGLGNSVQKMGYLPEPNTDFILAIISEEMGIFFVMGILALLGFIIARTVWIGVRANRTYESLICYGVATFFAIETFFNVGGVTGLLPITGVTLPFISYGGSSMMVLSASLGLVINISTQENRIKMVK